MIDVMCAALCTLSALLAATGPLAPWVWAADVANLFRPYALLASALVLAACLAARRVRFAALALALLGAEIILLAWPTVQGDAHVHGGGRGAALRVITFNCLGSNPNSASATAWIRRMHPDIVGLEELPPRWEKDLSTLRDILPYRASDLEKTPGDTDVFSRAPMQSADAYRPSPDLRTLVHATLVIGGRRVQVFGIHPNTLHTGGEWRNRNSALELAAQWVAQTRGQAPTLVLGDWNTPPWSPYFNAFLHIAGVTSADGVLWPPVSRVLAHPFGVRIGSPIDHIAVTPDLAVQGCETGPQPGVRSCAANL